MHIGDNQLSNSTKPIKLNTEIIENMRKQMDYLASVHTLASRQLIEFSRISQELNDQVSIINRFDYSINIPQIYLAESSIDNAKFSQIFEVSQKILRITEPLRTLSETHQKQIQKLISPFDLLSKRVSADLSAIAIASTEIINSNIFKELVRLVDFNRKAIDAFKDAEWPIAPSMSQSFLSHVIDMHVQGKTRYISRTIIGYYHRNNFAILKSAIDSWDGNPLFTEHMGIIQKAFEAHCRGEYELSVPALLPRIEGILSKYVIDNNLPAELGKISQVYNAVINESDEYNLSVWAISNTLLYHLQTNTYVFSDFEDEITKSMNNRIVTRHTVLHGISSNYNRPIHSLKAFLLLDAISALIKFDRDENT